ncbi:MAG TPA: hypothetical protein VJ010_03835 [Actinomycetota bacterium]|nr:hypothetical protein [Actinomycetota bacterium]
MLKRFALMVAASAVLAIPASGAFASQPPKTHGVLPEQACFAAYPAPVQPILCGQGTGGPGPGEPLAR